MSLIKEIHSSFTKAQEGLIKEAQTIISEKSNKQKIEQLAKLGFSNCANIKSLNPAEIKKAKELKKLVDKYSEIAPLYKFITEEKRIELCKRYGIIMADLNRFTGRIPTKNMDDILAFKISDNSYLRKKKVKQNEETLIKKGLFWPRNQTVSISGIMVKDINKEYLTNILHFLLDNRGDIDPDIRRNFIHTICYVMHNKYPQHLSIQSCIHSYNEDQVTVRGRGCYDPKCFYKVDLKKDPYDLDESISEQPEMYIISDISQLDTNHALIDDNMYLSEELYQEKEEEKRMKLLREEDPIVLCKVKGGYLIVTAWGDEASDPDVVNFNNN